MRTFVEITRTTALYPNVVFLQWNIDTDENCPLTVAIARSGGPLGPWEIIATGLIDTYNFLDNNFNIPEVEGAIREGANLYSLSREIYYQVTVTTEIGEPTKSEPRPVEPGLDRRTRLLKRKLLRDLGVGLRHLNGIDLIALKKRRWGTRCPKCWDPITKDGTLEHCSDCFGTTFEGGYWTPLHIKGRKDPAPVQTQMTGHGESDVAMTTFTTLDYPHLEHGDLIVDLRRNERWVVKMVAYTTLRNVEVHQKITCSLLGRSSVEYGLLVDPYTVPPLY